VPQVDGAALPDEIARRPAPQKGKVPASYDAIAGIGAGVYDQPSLPTID